MDKRKVDVLPYQEEWKNRFLMEQEKLRRLLPSDSVIFHHIGSTAVPGLSAKPIIDILAEADELELFDQYQSLLEEAGYRAKGENGIPGRRYFYKVNEHNQTERLVHLHAFQKGNSEVEKHLVFRDYLIAHPLAAKQYGDIKERAAKMSPYDIDSYIEMKTPLIKQLEQQAFQWWAKEKK